MKIQLGSETGANHNVCLFIGVMWRLECKSFMGKVISMTWGGLCFTARYSVFSLCQRALFWADLQIDWIQEPSLRLQSSAGDRDKAHTFYYSSSHQLPCVFIHTVLLLVKHRPWALHLIARWFLFCCCFHRGLCLFVCLCVSLLLLKHNAL